MNENKKYKVIKAVAENKKQKKRASVELNLSVRQINRLVKDYQTNGKEAFSHKNRGGKQRHGVPDQVKQQVVTIYQSFRVKPNVRHYTEILKEDYDINGSVAKI